MLPWEYASTHPDDFDLRPFTGSIVCIHEPGAPERRTGQKTEENKAKQSHHHMNSIDQQNESVRSAVREHYGRVAEAGASCGCSPTCCTPPAGGRAPVHDASSQADATAQRLGYSPADIASVPSGANLGLGCGNPLAIAALQPGETVLDLGSGAGFDAFLAARSVGPTGRVIGVDMTPEMISKARRNPAGTRLGNVEFRLGEIENLPVADATVDAIISNCVINLSSDKGRVFREAFRVLKPGGRLALSDIVALGPLPEEFRHDLQLHAGCVAGAMGIDELKETLAEAGFPAARIVRKGESREIVGGWFPGNSIEEHVASATIEAVKP